MGMRNAVVTLTGSNGVIRTAVTATAGVYQFDSVVIGESYELTVSSKNTASKTLRLGGGRSGECKLCRYGVIRLSTLKDGERRPVGAAFLDGRFEKAII